MAPFHWFFRCPAKVQAHPYATILECTRRSFSITSRTPAMQAKLPILMQWFKSKIPLAVIF